MNREIGGPDCDLVPVREVAGVPSVQCSSRGCAVPFSECKICERGTVVRLKGSALPYVVCASREGAPPALTLWPRDAVGAVMRPPVSVGVELSIEKLVRKLIDENVGAVPVVDSTGRAVGLVSRSNVAFDDVGWFELRDAALSAFPAGSERFGSMESEDDLYVHELLRDRCVGDVMTRAISWVSADVSVAAAAEVMTKNGLEHLMVLGADDRPVGMLSALDLTRWMAGQL
jgi:CBS domain-containing protein